MKRAPFLVLIALLMSAPVFAGEFLGDLSAATVECMECHKEETPGLYSQWGSSKHYGANVGCYECHKADKKDPDAFEHEGQYISIIVSPLDCKACHERETVEFMASHHASAGKILGSLDNTLGEVVEGPAAAMNGCKQCHGSIIKVLDDGSLDPEGTPAEVDSGDG